MSIWGSSSICTRKWFIFNHMKKPIFTPFFLFADKGGRNYFFCSLKDISWAQRQSKVVRWILIPQNSSEKKLNLQVMWNTWNLWKIPVFWTHSIVLTHTIQKIDKNKDRILPLVHSWMYFVLRWNDGFEKKIQNFGKKTFKPDNFVNKKNK